MKTIVNNILPPDGFLAINLCGIVFCRRELSDVDKNHEAIHTAQMQELLYLGFYLLYIIEYIYKLFIYCNSRKAYRAISFEVEAYKHEKELDYLAKRKHYAQW